MKECITLLGSIPESGILTISSRSLAGLFFSTLKVISALRREKTERKDAGMICDALGSSRCIKLAGETAFRELIDLYNIAHLLVSNDSGPPNLASLTPIKTLVFFGPESPVCYRTLGDNVEGLYADFLCSPCVSAYNHRRSACRDNRCLKAITVDEVVKKIESLLPQLRNKGM